MSDFIVIANILTLGFKNFLFSHTNFNKFEVKFSQTPLYKPLISGIPFQVDINMSPLSDTQKATLNKICLVMLKCCIRSKCIFMIYLVSLNLSFCCKWSF